MARARRPGEARSLIREDVAEQVRGGDKAKFLMATRKGRTERIHGREPSSPAVAPPAVPPGFNVHAPRGPDGALALGVAALRWTISGALRDQLIYMARQAEVDRQSLGHPPSARERHCYGQERRERARLRGLPDPDAYPRAHLAVPIEMDPGLDYRDRWINFVVRGGVQALE
jgi:hypothetical protein